LEDPDVDGKIILERILGKYGGKMWTGFIWLRVWALENTEMKLPFP
jgi:hypothetical protein